MGGKPRPARETAWHFLAVDADGKPVLRDRRPLVLGKWLEHVGPIVLCESGLHASTRAIDALHYAPGSFVTLVEVADVAYRDEDKLVCARRRPLWGYDATPVLRGFARRVAKSRLCDWRGPVPQVVLDWLDTGDETRRSAAESAAESAYNGWLEAMLTEGAAQLSQPVKRRPAVRRAR